MKNKFIIITNNPLVKEELGGLYNVEYLEISYEDILRTVRERIYKWHELLTHPLSGSVKPNETPYKSIMISEDIRGLDIKQMRIIESAIQSCKKFQFKSDQYAPQVYEDFQIVDLTLISSALPSATAW